MSALNQLGYGPTFPQKINSKGFMEYTDDVVTLVKSSIRVILLTPIGSRPRNKEFGSRLYELLFEPFDEITIALAYRWTIEAIERWEPRVILNDVSPLIDLDGKTLQINASYTIRNTSIQESFSLGIPRSF